MGVKDCVEIIPLVLPDLDMGPIHAAIRFCKGEISHEEFQKWLPSSPEKVMDPDPISIAPVLPAPVEDRPEVPTPEETRPEASAPIPEAIVVEASQVIDVEATALPSEAEPSHLPSELVEEELIAPARADL